MPAPSLPLPLASLTDAIDPSVTIRRVKFCLRPTPPPTPWTVFVQGFFLPPRKKLSMPRPHPLPSFNRRLLPAPHRAEPIPSLSFLPDSGGFSFCEFYFGLVHFFPIIARPDRRDPQSSNVPQLFSPFFASLCFPCELTVCVSSFPFFREPSSSSTSELSPFCLFQTMDQRVSFGVFFPFMKGSAR